MQVCHIFVNLQNWTQRSLWLLKPKEPLTVLGHSDNLMRRQILCQAPVRPLFYACICIVPALCIICYSSISHPFFPCVKIKARQLASFPCFSCGSHMFRYTNDSFNNIAQILCSLSPLGIPLLEWVIHGKPNLHLQLRIQIPGIDCKREVGLCLMWLMYS